ncbi:MAG: Signal transduction histidine kinase [Devosia sp.]|uniref:sensor histidine kinase n=1 Tax=Devosia sp. TaxID=1871048 RepID=UPI002602B947|nr:histidine kinase dimerization/phosphoacceptor domain -containing protein [Devosia sp.]MDB5541334.1 Signal transduction histidine kinase [Devosia sp.]
MAALSLPPEIANGLALAIVASSSAPMLLLDGHLKLLAASASFCDAFQIAPASVPGQQLASLGSGEWDLPQVASLLRATVSGDAAIEAYEIDYVRDDGPVRRLVLNAQKLDFADGTKLYVLLSISDVTEARLIEKVKEDLVREKAVLLQELQHRVANSLQIIASVLMQSARTVQSDETRGYLRDAHHRIMSVASVQRQLAVTRQGRVELRPYFTELCASIGASMIRDRTKVTLDVDIDNSSVAAEASVSLGLIVTELVINALKHAFPNGRDGKILVRYAVEGPAWALTVSDDGAGMSPDKKTAKAGLGTSIVEALTAQLGGDLNLSSSSNGTKVVITKKVATAAREPELRAV